MHVLYVHRNFPAQFGHIAARLIEDRAWQCTFVSERPEGNPGGVRMLQYKIDERNRDSAHPLAQVFDDYGRHCLAVTSTLKRHPEVQPDLIVGHCGFGSTALLRELYDSPIINFFEYYYDRHHSDIDFRPEFPATDFGNLRCRLRNAGVLVDLQNCDAGYSPTEWQRSRFPAEYQSKIETIFDGIDTDFWFRRPLAPGKPRWVWGRKLEPRARSGDPRTTTKVVTYVSRGFESIRGFDIFMKVAKRLCELRSDVIFVCVGTDEIHYGPDKRFTLGKSFREHVLAQDSYNLSRFIFTGRVSREELARIFSVSDLHIYLTVPFVLSWSCMNALACGCTVLGSATPPVQEVIRHEENGLLADFYDVDRFVELANKVLDDPQAYRPLGEAAVRMIEEKYSLDVCLPKMIDLYERTVAGYKKCGFPETRVQGSGFGVQEEHAGERHAVRARAIANTNGNGDLDSTTPLQGVPPIDAKDAKFSFTLTQPEPEPTRLYQRISQITYGPPAAPRGQNMAGKSAALAKPVAHGGNGQAPSRRPNADQAADRTRGRGSGAVRSQAGPGNENGAARQVARTNHVPRGRATLAEPVAHGGNGDSSNVTRVLFAIPHAFGRDPKKPFHSFRGAASERIAAMTTCLKLLHQTFGGVQEEMALFHTAFTPTNTALQHEIEVVVCTSGQRHLLGELELPAGYYRHEPRDCDPIMLGFECHALLRDNLGRYDFFCYLEDDLLIHDPWFFAKQRFFNLRAGNKCLLQPNRYEVEHIRPAHWQSQWHTDTDTTPLQGVPRARKTYIDGDLDEKLVRKYQNIDDQPEMAVVSMGVPIPCRRTLNPHCGGFFLNAEQMEHWSRQRHFLDLDCSFFSPIESANTFGVMRTFKIYKPAPAVANFLEIEHYGTSMTQRLRQRDGTKRNRKQKAPAAV